MRIVSCLSMMALLAFGSMSAPAEAFVMRLSQTDANQMVRMTFPQQNTYQGVDLLMTSPTLSFIGNNEVAVSLTIDAEDDAESVKARVSLSGQLDYQKDKRTLQIIQPRVTEFTVLEQTGQANGDLLKRIEQIKNKPAPFIMLVDFRTFSLPFLANQIPTDINVQSEQLVIEF